MYVGENGSGGGGGRKDFSIISSLLSSDSR